MHLAKFIRSDLERILVEWDSFARANAPSGSNLTDLALRDHAKEILLAIAADIETPQSASEQKQKSQGQGEGDVTSSAASTHGAQRQRNEYSLTELGAEFRALRSTVLRLWLPQVGPMSERTVHEVIRFNESIDQALAESLVAYTDATDHTRNLLLAVLGHDLRSPLATVALAGELLSHEEVSASRRTMLAHRVQRSADLMKRMVNDLLGYTRVQFGSGLPVHRQWCDVSEILASAIADAEATHPQTRYELDTEGELTGCYDATRLHQLFINLLVNAAQHGARSMPVAIKASVIEGAMCVRITNHGTTIPDAALKSIFKPLVQLAADTPSDTRPHTSLGLGLFIAREIAEGHGGTLTVTSDAISGTSFTVELPRDASSAATPGTEAS